MASGVPPMSQKNKEFHRFCFICFGNICRSPALAAIFNSLAKHREVFDQFYIDSMALTSYYLGRPADPRMCRAAAKKKIEIEHSAQLFKPSDFQRFDLVFAVTHDAADILKDLASTDVEKSKVVLATAFSQAFKNQDIPDPYYDGEEAFDLVVEMAFDACEGILKKFSA
jgi:protein-tyrosine phosphatase